MQAERRNLKPSQEVVARGTKVTKVYFLQKGSILALADVNKTPAGGPDSIAD